jgi:hypothetical protein
MQYPDIHNFCASGKISKKIYQFYKVPSKTKEVMCICSSTTLAALDIVLPHTGAITVEAS